MTFEWGDLRFWFKFTHAAENPLLGHISAQAVPYEDSVLPIELHFPPPLIECGSNRRAFEYQWEKLTYAFGLPDPASFPRPEVDPADLSVLTRFAEVGRRLAGYSAINGNTGLTIASAGQGNWRVTAEHPSDEAFAGTSVSFRQLHNNGEEASYDKVKGILFKSARRLPAADMAIFKEKMVAWDEARKSLMNKMLATLICEKAAPPNTPADFPFSYRGINPGELIVTYNYGDSLHWGNHRDRFVELTADPTNADYYKHACLNAIMTLSHLYFGVVEIVDEVLATTAAGAA